MMPTPIAAGVWMANNGRGVIFKLNNPTPLQNAFPPDKLKLTHVDGSYLVGIPYCQDSMQLLRNIGFNTDGIEPIRHVWQYPKVEGLYALMAHQLITAAFLTENPRAYVTSTMRVGKTASIVFAARFLQQRRETGAMLVAATVTNMRNVWVKEIRGMYPEARIVVLYDKDLAKRKAKLQQPADFYITNYDGLKLMKDELCAAVECGSITGFAGDELTHFANARSQLWDAADQIVNGTRYTQGEPRTFTNKITGETKTFPGRKTMLPRARSVKYAWGITGSPGDPEMIYGQVKLITPSNMPCLFTAWRDRTMIKIGFKYVPRAGYQEQIASVMRPCIRFDKSDIMDLPPVTVGGIDAPLSKEQEALCKAIRKDMVALADSGEKITATTKSALAGKLMQIAGGVVKVGENQTKAVDCSGRIDKLMEIINGTDRKVVIFSAYTAVSDRIVEELTKRGVETCIVDGRVSDTARDKIFNDFQNTTKYKAGVFHPRTTAFGVELAAADTMVFYGPPLSGVFVYQQALERLSSLKQQADQIKIYQLASIPEERKLFANIKQGMSINEAINDMFTMRVVDNDSDF